MNRSPDITEGAAARPARKTGRGKKVVTGSPTDLTVPILDQIEVQEQEDDTSAIEGPPPALKEEVMSEPPPVKRRPGRPKKNPGVVTGPKAPATSGAKRGRKPKNALPVEVPVAPLAEEMKMEVETVESTNVGATVDEIEANVKNISLSSTVEKEIEQLPILPPSSEQTSMEVEQGQVPPPVSVESIFMVKEEKSYGRNFIPGLDLAETEDVEVDSSTNALLEKVKAASTLFSGKKDDEKPSQDDGEPGEETKIRRSSRIKSLETQRGSRGRRREVVFSSSMESMSSSRSMPNLTEDDSNSSEKQQGGADSPGDFSLSSGIGSTSCGHLSSSGNNGAVISKPLKVKSRWRYSSDAETMRSDGMSSYDSESMSGSGNSLFDSTNSVDKSMDSESEATPPSTFVKPVNLLKRPGYLMFSPDDTELIEKLKKFQGIEDSIFKTERKISKESKGMICDCFLTPEDFERGEVACNEDCLNRLLMVECGARCPTGEMCANKKFQRKEYAPLEVFKTDKKGHGLRTLDHISEGGFVIEYVGEVLDPWQFDQRTKDYARGNQEHFYFMALKSDAIIDATGKGNCSRFINHSCEPNCETQKWTVNGELRIGFFTLRDLKPGEEIVFDYQFQRYGKKAQRCYCLTPSCRGWIGGEEEEDEDREDVGEIEGDVSDISEGLEREKVKRKPRGPRKKRIDTRILEDVALEEELIQLERSGLKNRTHTLTLSRLMVRAEKWDDRERILNILINGDSPCRRLFLDYRGLKLLYNWMVNLPLPANDLKEQLIRNEEYHKLFLKALQSLPIPNKTMLLDSKILSLIAMWSLAPSKTEIVEELPVQTTKSEISESTPDLMSSKVEVGSEDTKTDIEDIKDSSIKIEPTENAPIPMEVNETETDTGLPKTAEVEVLQTTATVTEIIWNFVDVSKSLLESWTELKEVFRIPKKERVEQMKEHEREADKASALSTDHDNVFSNRYSYDKDRDRSKWISSRTTNRDRDRRSLTDSFGGHRRMMMYPNMSKEERRSMFAARVAQEEEDMKQRRMQEEIVSLHQHRCGLLGLDPCTTPVVDVSGHYYLDPKTIEWKLIDPLDPLLPKELLTLVNAAQEPSVVEPVATEPSEIVFPPWPEGLPPPPPLPPTALPSGWKLAVDDEGRCYYFHIKSRQSQWHPPMDDDYVAAESTDSSDSDEDENETSKENEPPVLLRPIVTLRTKLMERAERRKKSGLVQERIISPRTDEDKSHISKAVIRARKLEVLEEKKQKIADDLKAKLHNMEGRSQDLSPNAGNTEELVVPPQTFETRESIDIEAKGDNSLTKKRKLDSEDEMETSVSRNENDDDDSESPMNTSPIETELDISLAAAEENDNLDVFASDSELGGVQENVNTKIPGLGYDPRDRPSSSSIVIVKKDKNVKVDKKQKAIAYKMIAADKCKDAFRSQIANVVVTHLNPYRKPDCKSGRIVSTEDFKHLARKMTHAIFLKELKNAREGKPLEVTDSVKHKTKEYIKKYMGRFGSSQYLPSPEDSQEKKE